MMEISEMPVDGGGFSQLEIVYTIIYQLNEDTTPNMFQERTLPCEHFDLIGGSDIGG